LFDGGGSKLNAIEHAGVEDIDTSIDAVSYELDWFLNETIYSRCLVGFVHNDTILGRLLHLGNDDCSLVTVLLVESSKLLERIVAGNVGIQDEEWGVVFAQNSFSELQRTGGAEGFCLEGEGDSDVVLLFELCFPCYSSFLILPKAVGTNSLQCFGHDLWAIVDSKNDVCDASSSQCLNLVLDHGLVRELNEWLWVCEGLQRELVLDVLQLAGCFEEAVRERQAYERSQTGSKPSDENDG
jgi:hypothetical protein